MFGRKRQLGFSTLEIISYVMVGIFAFTVIMKIGPHYVDDMNVASAIEGVHQGLAGKDIYEVTNADIKVSLAKYFQVSMLPDELLKQVEVERTGGKVLLKLNYDARTPFMGNIDILMRFKHEVDLAKPAAKSE